MSSMQEWACWYATAGWRVFPCEPRGKKPLVKWRDLATTDYRVIDTWWPWWSNANIGLVTGEHFDVIDFDTESAWGYFVVFCNEHDVDWTVYPRVKTGHGCHVYVKASGARNSAGRRPGIDVRGVGGYVIAPPSVHANGSVYTWIHPPPVGFVLPAYPVDGFVPKPVRVTTSQPPRAATTAASDGQESAYGIKARDAECEAVRTAVEGTRNATLNTAALKLAQLVAGGELDENTTRDMLRNAALDAGLDDGTEPPQIDATIASGWAKGITEPRNAPQSTLGRRLVQRTRDS